MEQSAWFDKEKFFYFVLASGSNIRHIQKMKTKTYTVGNVTFGFNRGTRSWEFNVVDKSGGNYTLYQVVPGGLEIAKKVAAQLSGSFKRGDKLDNLARKNIEEILVTKPE